MKLVIAIAVAVLGAVLVVEALSATSDLRGWPGGSSPSGSEVLTPARPGDPPFTIADCAAWTVDLNALPRSSEYQGTGTETLVACRSTSSFVSWLSLYALVMTSAALGWVLTAARRRRRPRGEPA